MNFWKAALTCFCVLMLVSCGVQKRLYRHGFYVPHASARISSQQDSLPVKQQTSASLKTLPVLLPAERLQATAESKPKLPALQTPAKSVSHKQDRSLHATQAFIPVQIKEQLMPKKSRSSLDTEDWLFIIGLSATFGGVAIILIGAAINHGNPAIGNAVMILGLIVCLVGLVFLGINDPSFFGDLLLGIIDALV